MDTKLKMEKHIPTKQYVTAKDSDDATVPTTLFATISLSTPNACVHRHEHHLCDGLVLAHARVRIVRGEGPHDLSATSML